MTGAPSASVTGLPAASVALTTTPGVPGVAPSGALIVPELSRSVTTRLPRVKGLKNPKSTVRFEKLSPATPCPGPPPRSLVGSVPGPRVTTPLRTPVVAGAEASTPLSFASTLAFGPASVVVEDLWTSRGSPAAKLALSTSTL